MGLSGGQSAVSVSGKRVRLSEERWGHIQARHPELQGWRDRVLEAVANPKFVVGGRYGELLAAKSYHSAGRPVFLVVVYRESSRDGFIITAYLTSDTAELERREKLWPNPF